MAGKIKVLLKKIGPGIITGASDDDPSGIATYAQTGAMFGYSQLWLSPISCIFAIAIQEMCGRIGLVTGKGLTGVMKDSYPKGIIYSAITMLFIANTINIGADLGAMAASVQMIFGFSFIFWILFMTALTLVLEIFIEYRRYSKILIWLTISLFAYYITALVIHHDWGAIIKGTFFPTIDFSRDSILNIVAFLGTTVSPYLFFWQADEEVEQEIIEHKIEAIGKGRPQINSQDVAGMELDTILGMIYTALSAFMIVITTAGTLHVAGITSINTAPEAAQALRPLAGDFAYLLFAIGIIGTGLLGVPVLAGSSSYAISEIIGWETGLGKKLKEAHGFYGVITIATIIGLSINFIGIDPMKALYYAAAVNGLMAPPLMLIILFVGNNKTIMGEYVNKLWANVLGIIATLVMGASGILLLVNLL
ncbi:MAG TPA: divalent metal cation transporter [Desulfitobacteriaceae bacterium]|nr:divalent metal cation transporter [Desulfitobacteriaceae bacterium]